MMPYSSSGSSTSSTNDSTSSIKRTTATTTIRKDRTIILPTKANTTTDGSTLDTSPSYHHMPLPLLPIQANTLTNGREFTLSKRKRRRTVSSSASLNKTTEIINTATISCGDNNAGIIVLHDDGVEEATSNSKTNNSVNTTPNRRKQNGRKSSYTKTLSHLNSEEDFDFLMNDLKDDPKKPFKITRRKSTPKRQNNHNNIDTTRPLNQQSYQCLDFDNEEEEPKKPFKITKRKKATPKKNNSSNNTIHDNDLQKCDLHIDKEESLKPSKAPPRKRTARKTNNKNTDEKRTVNWNNRKKTNVSSNLCGLCLSCSCKKYDTNNHPADDDNGKEGNKNDKMTVSLARSNAEVERALIARLARLEKSIAWFQHLHHKVFVDLKKLRSKYNNNTTTKNVTREKNTAEMPMVLLVPDARELEEIYEQEEREKRKETNDEETKCILELKTAKAQKIVFQQTTSKKS